MPVFVTDVRDVNHPYTYAQAVDLGRRDGVTGYVHSVDVDKDGIAWTSGYGGVRGYYTQGKHYDPVLKVDRWATAYAPVPYAGGGINTVATSALMHNSYRTQHAVGGHPRGDVVFITHESNTNNCARAGKFIVASIANSFDGQSWSSTPANPFRITKLGEYSPADLPGANPAGDCSAHWFTVKGDLVAIGFYDQGVRFLDLSDPTHPTQVGHFRVPARAKGPNVFSPPAVTAGSASAVYWHGDYVYVADYNRGIDVLKYTGNIPGKQEAKICWNACDK